MIEIHGLLKASNRSFQVGPSSFVPEVAPFKVELVRLNVIRMAFGQQLSICAAQIPSQRCGDFLGDRILNGKHVCEFLVEFARPKNGTVSDPQQAHCHAKVIGFVLHGAVENSLDTQPAPRDYGIQRVRFRVF